MTPRSWLYVPGDAEQRLAKVLDRGADAIIIDLEDGVAVDRKAAARSITRRWLAEHTHPGAEIWVRVNPGGQWAADLEVVSSPVLSGICLAKAEDPQEVAELARLLDSEASRCAIQPVIESGLGLVNAVAIARAPRVEQLQLGEYDLMADLRLDPDPDGEELAPHRAAVVVASAAAGLRPPVAPVTTEFTDVEFIRRSSARLRRMGFGSRACIHPKQVDVVNATFTPTDEAVEQARAVMVAYERGLAAGTGVTVGTDGRMVDEAVVRRARQLLDQRS